MVHNGIEYAMMQAYAEGYELLEKADLVDNVPAVFDSWRQGTVVRSWLLDLLSEALKDDPGLTQIRGYAEDSGEGRWTVEAAIDNAVPSRPSPHHCSPDSCPARRSRRPCRPSPPCATSSAAMPSRKLTDLHVTQTWSFTTSGRIRTPRSH